MSEGGGCRFSRAVLAGAPRGRRGGARRRRAGRPLERGAGGLSYHIIYASLSPSPSLSLSVSLSLSLSLSQELPDAGAAVEEEDVPPEL